MIIDFHTHIFPDAMADYAMKKLPASENEEYRAAATASALIENMDGAGIDKSVVLHVATKEHQHEDILKFAKEVDSERLTSFGSVIPYSLSALEYVWKISDEGLKGIKLHPPLQRCDADDERIFPVYDLARALNLVVLFHAGWDPSYRDEERCTPAMLLKILQNFPGLKVVAAHLGGMHYETLAGKADLYSMAEMNAIWQKASEEMYKNAGGAQQQGPFDGAQQGPQNDNNNNDKPDDNVTDVDFEEVK